MIQLGVNSASHSASGHDVSEFVGSLVVVSQPPETRQMAQGTPDKREVRGRTAILRINSSMAHWNTCQPRRRLRRRGFALKSVQHPIWSTHAPVR